MCTLGMVERFAPCRFAGICDRRKVIVALKLDRLTRKTPANGSVPRCNVQNQFPNAMGILYRTGCCVLSSNSLEDFEKRISVPRVSIEGTTKLVGEPGGLGHGP